MDLPQSMHEMKVGQSLQPPPPPKKKKASVWTERRMTTRHTNENKVEDFIFESSFFVSSASDFRELFRQLLKTFLAKFGTRRPSNKLSCLADVVAVEVGGEVVDDDVAVVVFDEAGRAKILYIISLLLLRKLSSFMFFSLESQI